jgi:hypothetical protein
VAESLSIYGIGKQLPSNASEVIAPIEASRKVLSIDGVLEQLSRHILDVAPAEYVGIGRDILLVGKQVFWNVLQSTLGKSGSKVHHSWTPLEEILWNACHAYAVFKGGRKSNYVWASGEQPLWNALKGNAVLKCFGKHFGRAGSTEKVFWNGPQAKAVLKHASKSLRLERVLEQIAWDSLQCIASKKAEGIRQNSRASLEHLIMKLFKLAASIEAVGEADGMLVAGKQLWMDLPQGAAVNEEE